MPRRKARSAGILPFRRGPGGLEVLLLHPGGPFWARRDLGAWSIPKGEVAEGEDEEATARRELTEETGLVAPPSLLALGEVVQKGGKTVVAWAYEGDCDPAACRSQTFRLEWPPRSGRFQDFPEADRAAFFDLAEARRRLQPAQVAFLERLGHATGAEERSDR